MSDEDWVEAAIMDDSVVVELLMRIHRSTPAKGENSLALPLEWSVRQRRSKPMPQAKKKLTSTASPTTPLSWSSGGGFAAAEGVEESSRETPKRPETTRSKVTATTGNATNKRSRKKKTLAELKEEEILLLKERKHLKRGLATLRVAVEKQRATNESLKRLKLGMESQSAVERVTVVASFKAMPDQTQQDLASCDPILSVPQPDVRIDDHGEEDKQVSPNGSSKLQQVVVNQENQFLVPDLNLPIEDSNSKVLHRVS